MTIDLRQGDCLELMKEIPDGSVDLVLTDPPYGVTSNKKDIRVNLDELFRVGKSVAVFCQQPFITELMTKFGKLFRYDLVWDKVLTTGFLNAKRMPLRRHETILIFGKPKYFPQMMKGKPLHSKGHQTGEPKVNRNYGKHKLIDDSRAGSTDKYPTSILTFRKRHPSVVLHATEKPVELMEWLTKAFSEKGDTILDPFMGSGTTGVACKRLNRSFIGFELDPNYFEIAKKRIEETICPPPSNP